MIKEDNEDLKNSTKCWIYDNDYINTDVKVRDDCYISGKYRRSAHILNHKIPIIFHNLKIMIPILLRKN